MDRTAIRRRGRVAAVAALAGLGLVACDPPPPRLQLAVTTTADGPDVAPGDGTCATAGGTCTLQAALQEASVAPDGADVAVPAGTYGGFDATVTGDVRINPAAQPVVTITDATFTVATGARLDVNGVNTSTTIAGQDLLVLQVSGSAATSRSVLSRVEVAAGGALLLVDSAVMTPALAPTVVNAGSLIAVRSSLLAHDVDGSPTDAVVHTAPGATTQLVASVIAQPHVDTDVAGVFPGGGGTCTGAAPAFTSFATAEVGCSLGGGAVPAGVRYTAQFVYNPDFSLRQVGSELSLDAGSRLVDAIPLADPACDTSAVDLYGRPRGVDGDGDGIGGCDIGALEQPGPDDVPAAPLRLGSSGNAFGGPGTGLWAQVQGPGTDARSGDEVNTRCLLDRNSTTCPQGANPSYVPPTDPDAGVWYVVEAPPGGGSVTVSIYDAQFTPGYATEAAGDIILGTATPVAITTTYRMFQQTDPLDFHAREPIGEPTPVTTPGACHWSVGGQAEFAQQWVELCTIAMAPGSRALLNVRTAEQAGRSSAGRNGFAVRACSDAGCTGPGQPTIHARGPMVAHVHPEGTTATYPLAEVGPQYAGRTLVVDLWDTGDIGSPAVWISPRMPSNGQPGMIQPLPAESCEITSDNPGYPRPEDLQRAGECAFRSTVDRTAFVDAHRVTLRIQIPPDYACTLGVEPATTPGSCWWGLRYDITAPSVDAVTWRAHIE